MIRNGDLNLIATYRVQAMSQRAADELFLLLDSHLKEHASLDRATFLLLADEAEAVAA